MGLYSVEQPATWHVCLPVYVKSSSGIYVRASTFYIQYKGGKACKVIETHVSSNEQATIFSEDDPNTGPLLRQFEDLDFNFCASSIISEKKFIEKFSTSSQVHANTGKKRDGSRFSRMGYGSRNRGHPLRAFSGMSGTLRRRWTKGSANARVHSNNSNLESEYNKDLKDTDKLVRNDCSADISPRLERKKGVNSTEGTCRSRKSASQSAGEYTPTPLSALRRKSSVSYYNGKRRSTSTLNSLADWPHDRPRSQTHNSCNKEYQSSKQHPKRNPALDYTRKLALPDSTPYHTSQVVESHSNIFEQVHGLAVECSEHSGLISQRSFYNRSAAARRLQAKRRTQPQQPEIASSMLRHTTTAPSASTARPALDTNSMISPDNIYEDNSQFISRKETADIAVFECTSIFRDQTKRPAGQQAAMTSHSIFDYDIVESLRDIPIYLQLPLVQCELYENFNQLAGLHANPGGEPRTTQTSLDACAGEMSQNVPIYLQSPIKLCGENQNQLSESSSKPEISRTTLSGSSTCVTELPKDVTSHLRVPITPCRLYENCEQSAWRPPGSMDDEDTLLYQDVTPERRSDSPTSIPAGGLPGSEDRTESNHAFTPTSRISRDSYTHEDISLHSSKLNTSRVTASHFQNEGEVPEDTRNTQCIDIRYRPLPQNPIEALRTQTRRCSASEPGYLNYDQRLRCNSSESDYMSYEQTRTHVPLESDYMSYDQISALAGSVCGQCSESGDNSDYINYDQLAHVEDTDVRECDGEIADECMVTEAGSHPPMSLHSLDRSLSTCDKHDDRRGVVRNAGAIDKTFEVSADTGHPISRTPGECSISLSPTMSSCKDPEGDITANTYSGIGQTSDSKSIQRTQSLVCIRVGQRVSFSLVDTTHPSVGRFHTNL